MDVQPDTINTFAVTMTVVFFGAIAFGSWLEGKIDNEKRRWEKKR
jgi:hypothetical protein